MRLIAFVLVLFLGVSAYAVDQDECESTVDMADSLNFYKLHVECDKDSSFSIGEKEESARNNKEAVTTYPVTDVETAAGAADRKIVVENLAKPGKVKSTETEKDSASEGHKLYNIREPFTLSGGPDSAIRGLFSQMAKYCPRGWTKIAEWVQPAHAGYFLHYQVRCSD